MLRSFIPVSMVTALLTLALAGCDRGADDAAQETAATQEASGPASQPSAAGEVTRAFAGTQLPEMIVEDPQGNTLDLAEQELPVLVNLWATWCAPCVKEMPALDNLAADMEGRLKVLTISQDSRTDLVPAFFEQRNFRHLEQWLDPENELAGAFSEGGQVARE